LGRFELLPAVLRALEARVVLQTGIFQRVVDSRAVADRDDRDNEFPGNVVEQTPE
jgi:hypothetical protein